MSTLQQCQDTDPHDEHVHPTDDGLRACRGITLLQYGRAAVAADPILNMMQRTADALQHHLQQVQQSMQDRAVRVAERAMDQYRARQDERTDA